MTSMYLFGIRQTNISEDVMETIYLKRKIDLYLSDWFSDKEKRFYQKTFRFYDLENCIFSLIFSWKNVRITDILVGKLYL